MLSFCESDYFLVVKGLLIGCRPLLGSVLLKIIAVLADLEFHLFLFRGVHMLFMNGHLVINKIRNS